MIQIGVLLLIFGVGSLLLPMFDMQFRLMSILDDFQPVAGILVAGLGALLIILGLRQREVAAAAAPPPAPEATGAAGSAPETTTPPNA